MIKFAICLAFFVPFPSLFVIHPPLPRGKFYLLFFFGLPFFYSFTDGIPLYFAAGVFRLDRWCLLGG